MFAIPIQEFSALERELLNHVHSELSKHPDSDTLIEFYTPSILGLRNLQYHKPFDWCCCTHEDKFYQMVALL